MLVEDKGLHVWLFLITGNQHDRFLVVVYRIVFAFGAVRLCRNIGEHLFDLSFDGIYIDVTYHYYALQVGTIPFLIIIP